MSEILFIVLIAGLWRAGGDAKGWSGCRDIFVPVLLMVYYAFVCHWAVGILTGGLANTIRIGYGAYDPEHDDKPSWLAKVTKDREGWKIRGIYGAITSFAIGLAPTVYYAWFMYGVFSPETLWRFLGYIVFNIGLEIGLNKAKANVWWTELGNGAGRASVILWVR